MQSARAAVHPPPAHDKWLQLPPERIGHLHADARRRLLELVDDLSDAQWRGEPKAIANPIAWEVGHVAHFYERFLLPGLGVTESLSEDGQTLYNSFALDRDARWNAALPSRRGTLEYLEHVTWYVRDWLEHHVPDAWETYLHLTAILHEEMHNEAITWYRQTQGYAPPPRDAVACPAVPEGEAAGPLPGDVEVPGCVFYCGSMPDQPYVWDNEKWAHPVEVPTFRIARAPVTQAEFAAFVSAGGYRRDEHWGFEGLRWRDKAGAAHPLYWRPVDGGWERMDFERWVPLEPHRPMVHVNWYEAEAWCAWAGRRLPTEAEWELAASGAGQLGPQSRKRTYPWGDAAPTPDLAHLNAGTIGCVDVAAFPAGDSAVGCRQMIGNVWEWTASAFYPYPGYVVDTPYREYSAPWFGNHRVLRGGSWATRAGLVRNSYRNFFQPDRRDLIAGFRTCAP